MEHALDGYEEEQQRYRQQLDSAERRLASYRSRDGGTFAFADELTDKRRQLRENEASLVADRGSSQASAA